MARRALSWYVHLVIAAGGAVAVHSLVSAGYPGRPHEWILFAVLGVLAGSLTIRIATVEASISVADTFFIAAAMLFGPAAATAAIALDSLVLSWRKKHPASRVGFNVAAPALSLWIASHVFFLLAGIPPLSIAHIAMPPIGPLLAMAGIYFLLNSSFIAFAVALESGKAPVAVWREHFMWLGVGYFAAASMAFCLTFITQQIGLGAVAVVIPVLITFHLTFRASFGRLEDARRHVTQVDRLYTSTIETLAMAIDAKDDVTHNHVRRVQAYARALAEALGVNDESTLKAIDAAALLHDTGKLGVPERILNKPGGLTPSEFEQMKKHVDVGADILSLVDFPYPVVPIVRCHHENWDGTGYPAGVSGEAIPIGARILSVVDCFDALTSDRPYRKRLSNDAAVAILVERRGRMYDPLVVDMFIKIHGDVHVTESADEAEREVLQRISAAKRGVPSEPQEDTDSHASALPVSEEVLAFVSLARLASGRVSVGDVLALSTNLVKHLVPSATGAWFLRDGEHLVVVDAFGPGAAALRDLRMGFGERVSGWVASHHQVMVNSDAAIDLREVAGQIDPPLVSCLAVPLASGKATVGVLALYSQERDGFDENQGRLLQMIVPHVAQALASASSPAATLEHTPSGRELRLVASR
jgi:putative nucleotidyltransferase with HDIG domain